LNLPATDTQFLVGVDENGLGARLGPLLVTGVLAEVTPAGRTWLKKRLPVALARDLDDSKKLVAFGNSRRGEAWARALVPEALTPADLFAALTLESTAELRRPCPAAAVAQCWGADFAPFEADTQLCARTARHLERLRIRGVHIRRVQCSVVCVGNLNSARQQGIHRFTSDLHAMERLLLAFRAENPGDLRATCGKVGGITDYPRYFGPLAGRLHTVLRQDRTHSAYLFPGLGEVHFVQDADASDPLVMLASMVGKYVREASMARISQFYVSQLEGTRGSSGYHDSVTSQFIAATAVLRKRRRIPQACFERE
jgi:ribonuclease HII